MAGGAVAMTDNPETRCAVCGSHINAGSYPPVCSERCRLEWEIETEFMRWARREEEHERRGLYSSDKAG